MHVEKLQICKQSLKTTISTGLGYHQYYFFSAQFIKTMKEKYHNNDTMILVCMCNTLYVLLEYNVDYIAQEALKA